MINSPIGTIFVVAAPSGGGKTSLVRQLVNTETNIVVSISHTTRAKRPGEEHGVDYFFVDNDHFAQMVQQNAFVEYAKVFDYNYGTSVSQIMTRLRQGIDIVLDIDWQGAMAIKNSFPTAVTIFIIPPSLISLRERLLKRNQDNELIIERRMQLAHAELSHYTKFDYLIVNDVFSQAADELIAIVKAERCRLTKQIERQKELLASLLKEK